ncbi:tRNA uridine-5-carboxymethylaminomethyl(34) synthesis GTPase MnmE [Ruminococcaceae bacterium OttesenSCG-928-I18]|nr:tRNA uridine-5-carboxymethylaminomethyl(34) synthesis GTPase MnmE [Ruminococcaceae bacterium OttesenSCG-928-I18]
MRETTIAAIATPPGTGGIAVIRISGPESIDVAKKIFVPKNAKKTLKKAPGYSALYGNIVNENILVDSGIALIFRSPHSYTGEDTVEISCHGGDTVSSEVLAACLNAGANIAQPGEFTKRAFLNGKMDLQEAEAVIDLITSKTMQQNSYFNYTRNQRKTQIMEEIKAEIQSLMAHLMAWIDYPEEDVPSVEEQDFLGEIQKLKEKTQRMLGDFEKGQRQKRGLRVVLLGEPNVGKSTLFNLLVEDQRSIVTPIAGTTRDIIREEAEICGYPILLSDTAGLREGGDEVEEEGIRRSWDEISSADILVQVLEAGRISAYEENLVLKESQKPKLCIVNKSDQGCDTDLERIENDYDMMVIVSAKEAPDEARETIKNAIRQLLQIQPLDPDAVLLSNQRQRESMQKVDDCLAKILAFAKDQLIYDDVSIYLQEALEAIGELKGENVTDAVLEEVFSKFCVGK